MTVSPATQSALPAPLRQHTDPPGLWIVVVAVSLLLNGTIAFSLYHYFQHIAPEAAEIAPIAVDFVPARSPIKSGSQTSAIGRKQPSPPAIAAPHAHPPRLTLTPQSHAAPVSPTKPAPSRPHTPPDQSATHSPQPTAHHTNSERSESSPSTASPMTEPNSTEPDPPPATDSPPSNPNLATSTRRLPDFAVPPDPTVNTSTSQSEITDTLAIARQATPVQVAMYVKLHSPEPTLTASTHLMPTEQTKTFVSGDAGCIVTPATLQSFGQSVDLAVQLSPQGAVLEATPLPASRDNSSPRYQDLVACFLKTWTFAAPSRLSSATEAGSPQFRVTVTLEKY